MTGGEILRYDNDQNIEVIETPYDGKVTFTRISYFNDHSAYDMSLYVPDDFKVKYEYQNHVLRIFRETETTFFTLEENGMEIDKGRFEVVLSMHKEFLPPLLKRFVFERVQSMPPETRGYFSLNDINPDIIKVFVKKEPLTRKAHRGMTQLNLEATTSMSRLDLIKEEMSNLLLECDAAYLSHVSFGNHRETTTMMRMRPRNSEFKDNKISDILIHKFSDMVHEAKLRATDDEIMALSLFSRSVFSHCEASFDWLVRNHPYANNAVNKDVPLSVTFQQLSEVIEAARTYPLFGLYVSGNRGTNVKLMMEAVQRKYEILIDDVVERLSNENGVIKFD